MYRLLSLLTFCFILTNVHGSNGKENRWLVPIGVGVVMVEKDRVLMLKRTYKEWGFGVIAGEVEKGETLRQTAVRKAQEEVGVKIDEKDLHFLCVVHYRTEDQSESPLVFFFTTGKWIGNPFNREPEKHSHMEWFHLDDLPTPLAPGEELVLERCKSEIPTQNAYLQYGWTHSPEK